MNAMQLRSEFLKQSDAFRTYWILAWLPKDELIVALREAETDIREDRLIVAKEIRKAGNKALKANPHLHFSAMNKMMESMTPIFEELGLQYSRVLLFQRLE